MRIRTTCRRFVDDQIGGKIIIFLIWKNEIDYLLWHHLEIRCQDIDTRCSFPDVGIGKSHRV
ncbi:MAG TPA: hypothetical protein VFC02_19235, partial [Anaerolineales bacterium]|nr:hypothetical protein [Anaerolineales bacterium]